MSEGARCWQHNLLEMGWEVVDAPAGLWTSAFLLFKKRVVGGVLLRSVYIGPHDDAMRPQHVQVVFVPAETS